MPRVMQAELLGRLAIALSAGIDPRKAWAMELSRVPVAWRRRLEPVAAALARGCPWTEALAAADGVFPRLVLGVAAVGDRTGHEAESFRELAGLLDRSVRTSRQLRRGLVGPVIQMAVAVAVVGFLIFMAGMMAHDMLGLGLRGMSGLLTFGGWLVAAAVIGRLLWGQLVASWRRHGLCRRVLDYVPVIGPASRAAEAAAWCRVAGLASGVGLDAGRLLELAAGVAPGLAVDPLAVEERLRRGATLAEALDRTGRFPLRVLEVLAVGEATGNVPETLDRLAGQLDDEARAGFEASAQAAGWLVSAAVAVVIAVIIMRIFSVYLGTIQSALGGR